MGYLLAQKSEDGATSKFAHSWAAVKELNGLGFRVIITLERRIKWKRTWRMKWKLGQYRGLRNLF